MSLSIPTYNRWHLLIHTTLSHSGNKVLTGSVQGAVNEMSLASEPSVLILVSFIKLFVCCVK